MEGIPLADCRPHSNPLLEAIGGLLGSIDRALLDFDHPAVHRTFVWDLRAAERTFQDCLADVTNKGRRRLAESLFEKSWGRLSPETDHLRRSVIHGDANDYTLLARNAGVDSPPGWAELLGLVDFGDLIYSWTIAELDLSVGSSGIPEATARGGDQEAMESQHQDFIVLEGAYHGNTSGLIDISPYKFEGPGGSGCPKHVHVAPTPDDYRGPFKRHEPRAGFEYARLLSGPIEQARNQGEGLAAFICESAEPEPGASATGEESGSPLPHSRGSVLSSAVVERGTWNLEPGISAADPADTVRSPAPEPCALLACSGRSR